MPRLTRAIPKYRKHRASGQAIVTLDGQDFYLGPHGTNASHLEYDRLTAEWLANGRRLARATGEPARVTVVELAAAFWQHAKGHYVKNGRPTNELAAMRVILRYLRELYGHTDVADFRPLCLEAVRQKMIDSGNCRRYINQNVSRIVHVFKWGVSKELVPESVHRTLATVEGLQEGKCKARESAPVLPIDDTTVDATLPHLPAVVADMVKLQRLTGMRPGEVVLLRPCDIIRTGDVWEYRPAEHKMQHKGRGRVIPIGPQGQSILLPYLLRDAESYCFILRRSKSIRYTARTYLFAIHRACDLAFQPPAPIAQLPKESVRRLRLRLTAEQLVELAEWQKQHRWEPNQLRHSTATEIRRRFGLEGSQVVLGHSKADTTQIYAERDLRKAKEIMREVG